VRTRNPAASATRLIPCRIGVLSSQPCHPPRASSTLLPKVLRGYSAVEVAATPPAQSPSFTRGVASKRCPMVGTNGADPCIACPSEGCVGNCEEVRERGFPRLALPHSRRQRPH
jgi:hypothetical protein